MENHFAFHLKHYLIKLYCIFVIYFLGINKLIFKMIIFLGFDTIALFRLDSIEFHWRCPRRGGRRETEDEGSNFAISDPFERTGKENSSTKIFAINFVFFILMFLVINILIL